jgi:hypothetical protein
MAWGSKSKDARARLGETVRKARSLSNEWRREADRTWRKASRYGHRAEDTMKGWWVRMRPKVIEFEHRFGDVAIKVGKAAKRAS